MKRIETIVNSYINIINYIKLPFTINRYSNVYKLSTFVVEYCTRKLCIRFMIMCTRLKLIPIEMQMHFNVFNFSINRYSNIHI